MAVFSSCTYAQRIQTGDNFQNPNKRRFQGILILPPFSPFLTISLCRAGHYFSHPVFSILVCWYFSTSPFMLSLRLLFNRPRLLLPETSSLSDFARMWLCSHRKQWPNQFSSLFSRKVSTSFTCTSSILMWFNLVCPSCQYRPIRI